MVSPVYLRYWNFCVRIGSHSSEILGNLSKQHSNSRRGMGSLPEYSRGHSQPSHTWADSLSSCTYSHNRLGNNAFVATTTATYFLLNFIKIPFYFRLKLFSVEILIEALALLPFIGLGVLIGISLNNRVPELLFSRIVLFCLFSDRCASLVQLTYLPLYRNELCLAIR